MLYSGELTDPTSGLQYLRARWYDAALGRFTTRDPYRGSLSLPQSLNSYGYVHNNPISNIDPSGKSVAIIWGVALVATGLAMQAWGYMTERGTLVSWGSLTAAVGMAILSYGFIGGAEAAVASILVAVITLEVELVDFEVSNFGQRVIQDYIDKLIGVEK